MTRAQHHHVRDKSVRSILFNIFGGITRCDDVARGLVTAFDADEPRAAGRDPPDRHEREGSARDPEADSVAASPPRPWTKRSRRPSSSRLKDGDDNMSILIDKNTRLVVQGITGRDGSFHAAQMMRVRHQRGGRRHARQGRHARSRRRCRCSTACTRRSDATGANTSVIYVRAPFAADAICEAADCGHSLRSCASPRAFRCATCCAWFRFVEGARRRGCSARTARA